MKKFCLAVMFLMSSLSALPQKPVNPQKMYLDPSHIRVVAEGLFVFVNNNWVQTSQLQSDGSGVFVEPHQFGAWYCNRCGQWTTGWWACEHCGNPK